MIIKKHSSVSLFSAVSCNSSGVIYTPNFGISDKMMEWKDYYCLLITCTSKNYLKLFDSESYIHGIILLTFQNSMLEKEVTDLIMGGAMGWRGVAGRGVGEE